MESKYPNAEQDSPDSFKFIQPDGALRLCLETPQEKGWIVHPKRDPMEVCMCLLLVIIHDCLYFSCVNL